MIIEHSKDSESLHQDNSLCSGEYIGLRVVNGARIMNRYHIDCVYNKINKQLKNILKMKKLLFSIIAILGFVGFAKADDTYAHDASVLPKAAQTTIANNFKAKVSVVKIDKDFGRISEYETILTDGTEISFDRDGNWENVEVNNMHSVPAGFIPKEIRAYVNSNHKGMRIVGIDKERSGYDVELSNGIEMKFDKTGKFLRYDD